MNNQKGIAQVLILILLVGAIALGTVLVKQRTNLVPHAQQACTQDSECSDLEPYCQGEETYQCTGGYCSEDGQCVRACEAVEGNPLNCGGETKEPSEDAPSEDAQCPDKKYYCDYNVDPKGRRVLKTGGYYDPSHSLADSSGCVYDFQNKGICQGDEEVIGTPAEGNNSNPSSDENSSKCADNGLEYCQDGKTIRKFNGIKDENGDCQYEFKDLGLSEECKNKNDGDIVKEPQAQTSAGSESSPVCTEAKAAVSTIDAKVLTNLAYYKAILKGTSEICIKADLGMEPHLFAHSESDPANERRLFMCSGSEGQIKWRVVSEDGETLVPTLEEFSKDPDNLPNREQAQKAEEAASL